MKMENENENLEKQVIEDSINFCLEASKIPNKLSFFRIEIGMEHTSNIDVVYQRPETPKYLEKNGIISIISPISSETNTILYKGRPKGGYSVFFDSERAKEWLDCILDERVEIIQNSLNSNKVSFDVAQSEIIIGTAKIPIPCDTNQFYLCKTILTSKNKKKNIWNWDEIIDDWGDDVRKSQKNPSMVVYSAANEINNKVEKITKHKDFFKVTTRTVQLNSRFI